MQKSRLKKPVIYRREGPDEHDLILKRKLSVIAKFAHVVPRPPLEILWTPARKDRYFTREELLWLPPAHCEAILRLISLRYEEAGDEFMLDGAWMNGLTGEELHELLRPWEPWSGAVHVEELASASLIDCVRQKFEFPLAVVISLAEDLRPWLIRRGRKHLMQPVQLVAPSMEDKTHLVVYDCDLPICYLRGLKKAQDFCFYSLSDLASFLVTRALRILQVFEACFDAAPYLSNVRHNPELVNHSLTHHVNGGLISHED